ncbi:hypothetical protein E9993_16565 [Labilibacter sediminis]|nr:hypothetical protein E9993_16565 [Labilibacter sediminis]
MIKPGIMGITLLLMLLCSCNPYVHTTITQKYPTTDYKREIIVLPSETPTSGEYCSIGTLDIGDTGFTINCSYEKVIERAKMEARKAGGDAIKITRHVRPDLWSSCHRITAEILKLESASTKL